jgi:hypothetical protein
MASTPKDQQQRSKPMPATTRAQHGGRTMYMYGCRCDACRKAEADYQRERTQAKKQAALATEGATTRKEKAR